MKKTRRSRIAPDLDAILVGPGFKRGHKYCVSLIRLAQLFGYGHADRFLARHPDAASI